MSYADGTNIAENLVGLTKEDIITAGAPIKFGRTDARQRHHLLQTVAELPVEDQERIRARAASKRSSGDDPDDNCHVSKRHKVSHVDRDSTFPTDEPSGTDTGQFLEAPSDEIVQSCIANFIDRTGNLALATVACMVCAREVDKGDTESRLVDKIPNGKLLSPVKQHPAHNLTSGMLLHLEAITQTITGFRGTICNECLSNLYKNRLPRMALANDMWIGDVPFELSVLTLPEQILIARHFPAANIVKLYPQKKGAQSANCALRGNVSTYRLNTEEIADMVQGNIMPHPSRILASTIGVTIIGPTNVRERTLPNFLWVRRKRVRNALAWLKVNNPLYADITISEERLDGICEEGVPDEILNTMRHSDDIEELERERAGYVPEDGDLEDASETEDIHHRVRDSTIIDEDIDPDEEAIVAEPTVIPLQALGVIDVGATHVGDNEVLANAMANITSSVDDEYAVRRGSSFVNEYPRTNESGQRTHGGTDNPNHLLGAYPMLWPYGMGGIETRRAIDVPYNIHARWCLQYSDKRFRHHGQFIFQAFGVLQKRQMCASASLQVSRKAFLQHQSAFQSLTPKDFVVASAEEIRKVPFSNPTVKALRNQLSTVRAKVMGTDESRIKIRGQIRGMNMMKGPPSLWITINPSDVGDPIAQVLAGEQIDLDSFERTAGPNSEQRNSNIARDPFAAAKFFHFVIGAIIEELFGIKGYSNGTHVKRTNGIFGKVASYVGTVEAQGRGTLHLHIVVWLVGALTHVQMKEALKSETFRLKVKNYIKANIRADLDGADKQTVLRTATQPAVSYSRPVDPREPGYSSSAKTAELRMARTVQHHRCTKDTCLVSKKGMIRCKRRAPFDISTRDYIDENGAWGPKRTYAYINNWCPPIMQCIRANQDIKMITSGAETMDIAFYISMYVAKRQANSSNASALLAKKLAFHKARERYNSDISQLNKRLLQRCANTLTREQEFSAPEVVSYLMGWGDRYISHWFVTIYWNAVASLIRKTYPDMNVKRHKLKVDESTHTKNAVGIECDDGLNQCNNDDTVELTAIDGVLEIKDQLKEYVDRGNGLAESNLLDFFLNTYERDQSKTDTQMLSSVGRKPNDRVPYLENTGHGKKCRVIRSPGHETMPNFVGEWFPRNDVPELQEYYHASMLALFTPWTNIARLKGPNQTFKQAFEAFIVGADDQTLRTLDNIQYQYECSDSARKKREEQTAERFTNADHGEFDDNDPISDSQQSTDGSDFHDYNQQDIENTLAAQFSHEEKLFAEVATNIAFDQGIFKDDQLATEWHDIQRVAEHDDLVYFQELEAKVKAVTKNRHVSDKREDIQPESEWCSEGDVDPDVQMVDNDAQDLSHLEILNTEQRRAHEIVANHLRAHIDGRQPKQMLMIITGQGGTGKSTLLNAITTTFERMEVSHLLGRTALSGIAASLIGGTTLHWYGGLPPRTTPQSDIWPDNPSKTIRERRTKNLQPILWLAVDEMSMCTLDLLTLLSQVAGKVRVDNGKADSTIPFGGLNVMLMGDFHQFPPVGATNAALYCPPVARNTANVGKAIYHQFDTVVNLIKQERIRDPIWKDILQRSRVGECTENDIQQIQKLVITNPECDIPDFNTEPWDTVTLVTPRNCVRTVWNRLSLRKHCRKTGHILYICDAEDTTGNDRQPTNIHQKVIIAGMTLEQTKKVTQRIEFAIGMQVMVTLNVATEADLANGSRGVIENIVLDPRESSTNQDRTEEGIIWLQYPPAMILFRPFHHEFDPFPGLEPGLIPIFPSEVSFTIKYQTNAKTRVIRRQYPICAGYAFTDHKAQGQTLERVLVDIGTTQRFPVTPFAAYVALSRSRGRDTIRLLRNFDDTIFTRHPSEYLRREDERLAWLEKNTTDKFETGSYNFD